MHLYYRLSGKGSVWVFFLHNFAKYPNQALKIKTMRKQQKNKKQQTKTTHLSVSQDKTCHKLHFN